MHWSVGFVALAAYAFFIWWTWPRSNRGPQPEHRHSAGDRYRHRAYLR